MAAMRVIVVAQCCESTESMGQIVEVGVIQSNCPGSAVEAGCRENAVREVMREVRVSFKELLQVSG